MYILFLFILVTSLKNLLVIITLITDIVNIISNIYNSNVTCKSKFPHDMEFTFTKYTLFVYGIY